MNPAHVNHAPVNPGPVNPGQGAHRDTPGPASGNEATKAPRDSHGLRSQLLTTSRGTLQLWRRGAGPIVVLLHDLGRSHASFSPLLAHIPQSCHACAVDLLGHGGSSHDVLDFAVAAQATALDEIFAELQFQHTVLVGHGLGGSVAIRLAASAPGRVKKLVLIAAGSYPRKLPWRVSLLRNGAIWNTLGALGRSARRRCAARSLLGDYAFSEEFARSEWMRGGPAWRALGRAFRQNTDSQVISEMEDLVERHLEHPTLAVWGTDDASCPVAAARILYQEKPNARFLEIAGGSHAPHEDHPEIVAELIHEFLE